VTFTQYVYRPLPWILDVKIARDRQNVRGKTCLYRMLRNEPASTKDSAACAKHRLHPSHL